MQAGILYGAIDAMEGMVGRLQGDIVKREGQKAQLIATGGFSKFIAGHTSLPLKWEPSLVLEGVRLVYDRISKSRSGARP